jgi:chaperonin cofactor prefoldin
MTALYELSDAITALSEMEEDQAVIDTLEGLEMEFNDKAQNIVLYERDINGKIEAIDSELKRLQTRNRTLKNRIDSMKEYLRDNMERTGISKIECPLFTISCVKGRDKAEVLDETLLPDDCVRVKTSIEADKTEILKKLQAGEDVPGAELAKTKSSIRIT